MSAEKICFLVVSIFVVCQVNGFDYCNIKGCEPGKHVKCLYPNNNVNKTSCGDVTAVGMSTFDRDSLVDSINAHRNENYQQNKNITNKDPRLMDIEWSPGLAEIAQRWANQCTTSQIPDGCNTLTEGKTVYQRIYEGPEATIPYQVMENVWNVPGDAIFNPTTATKLQPLNLVGCGRILASKGNYQVCLFSDSWANNNN